jgi:hypothetical protein
VPIYDGEKNLKGCEYRLMNAKVDLVRNASSGEILISFPAGEALLPPTSILSLPVN